MKKLLNLLLITLIILGYTPTSNAMFARALAYIGRFSRPITPRTIITPRSGITSKITLKSLHNQFRAIGLTKITSPQTVNRNSSLFALTRSYNGTTDEKFYTQRNGSFDQYTRSLHLCQTQPRWFLMSILGMTTASSSDDDNKETEQKSVHDPVAPQAEELALEIFNEIAITYPDPDTTIETLLKNLSYEKQDQFLAAMMRRLLDENDKRNFKPIARLALNLEKVWEKHPKLHQLIKAHAEKPSPVEFTTTFKQLTNADRPPTFNQTYQTHHVRVGGMGNLYYLIYLRRIYCKF